MKENLALVMRALLGLMFVGSGIMHMINPAVYLPMMPDYLPFHLELIYLSGVIEIVLGVAFFIERFRRMAAWGMIALMLAVFPANIHMFLHAERFPDIPYMAHLIRLPMQGVFIWWAWLYTRTGSSIKAESSQPLAEVARR